MKEFNLDAALNGEPVQLRNGQKAYVVGLSKVGTEDGNSYIVGEYERNLCSWSKDGKYWLKRESEWDIVGMWEEPKLTSEQVLEKAYQEGLRVRFDDVFEYPVAMSAIHISCGAKILGNQKFVEKIPRNHRQNPTQSPLRCRSRSSLKTVRRFIISMSME